MNSRELSHPCPHFCLAESYPMETRNLSGLGGQEHLQPPGCQAKQAKGTKECWLRLLRQHFPPTWLPKAYVWVYPGHRKLEDFFSGDADLPNRNTDIWESTKNNNNNKKKSYLTVPHCFITHSALSQSWHNKISH